MSSTSLLDIFTVLVAAGSVALFISTTLAIAWPVSQPDGIEAIGLGLRAPYELAAYVWIYCIIWWFIQDMCKVAFCSNMVARNWFGYCDTGKLVLPDSVIRWQEENKYFEPAAHH